MTERPDLLFVSTRFLFPVDSGGKIRTTQILRGLKGGRFRVVLVSPATPHLVERHKSNLESVCDEFQWWPLQNDGPFFHYTRLRHIVSRLPIPVRTDLQAKGVELVAQSLARNPSVAVFDFAHAAVLAPGRLSCPSVMFTHNVEAEIFKRHLLVAKNFVLRALWKNQYNKMLSFEAYALKRFDLVVAVADRDAEVFAREYGADRTFVIPTGVDLDFFAYAAPERDNEVVFCGSMDWLANQEAVAYFMNEVWEHVSARVQDARMTVVGRSPPAKLVDEAKRRGLNWRFTGFVDDVREYIRGAAVSVLPLRVGGGTRLKVFEAMAIGTPLVSTAVGVEGLPLTAGEHYVLADEPAEMGRAVANLLTERDRRRNLARAARRHVEQHFSYRAAAAAFEQACEQAAAGSVSLG